MRITCPNCLAQYDVDPAMIPAAGRDVQCSSCAHTWLQGPPETAEEVPVADEQELDEAFASEADAPEDSADDTSSEVDETALEDAPEITLDEDAASDAEGAETVPADADADADDKLRAALDRPKVEDPEPEDPPTDVAAEIRDAVTAPSPETTEPETAEPPTAEADDASGGDIAGDAATESADADDAGAADAGDFGEAAEADGGSDADDINGDPDPATQDISEETEAAASASETPDRPGLDGDVAEILREEAEREVTQRRGEDAPPALEPQGELGLAEEERPSEVLRERLDRMRGDGVPQSTVAQTLTAATSTPLAGPRKERLPDIEEISSTLRPGETEEGQEPPIPTGELNKIRQSGFRRGFATLVFVAAAAVAAYVFAPQIVGLIPASEPVMISYVETANGVRDGIDRIMARAISGLNALTGDA